MILPITITTPSPLPSLQLSSNNPIIAESYMPAMRLYCPLKPITVIAYPQHNHFPPTTQLI